MTYGAAGRALGVPPNSLRYAAPTGTVLIRWEGARQPTIWTVPRPDVDPRAARRELARRYLHVFGPTTPAAFAIWAGIGPADAASAFDALKRSLTAVRTPIGDAWILSRDEEAFHAPAKPGAAARLLPSGDAYYLLQGADRELLVPDAERRGQLWTSRVWPGAVLVAGEIVGTWRRAQANLTITPWVWLARAKREAVEAEAQTLPLPGVAGRIAIRWED
jgi:winged helix DNA-binding protein